MSPRPHLPFHGVLTGPNLGDLALIAPPRGRAPRTSALTAGAEPDPLPALKLDPLTAVDNPGFYRDLAQQANLPTTVRDGLAALEPD